MGLVLVLTCEDGHSLDRSGPVLSLSEQQPYSVAEAVERRVEQQRLAGVGELDHFRSRFSGDLSSVG